MNVKTTSLAFCAGSSDKEYHLSIEERNGKYDVLAAWGRRGATPQTGTKASQVTLAEAEKVYDKIISEKVGKGYKPTGESNGVATSITNTVASHDQRDTGLRPQLLTPIAEEDAEQYLTDDSFCAQEKFDGKRMTIKKAVDVIAANKKGLSVGFPNCIAMAIQAIAPRITVDGEIVGDTIHVFDLLQLGDMDMRNKPYAERLATLRSVIGDTKAVKIAQTALGTQAKRAMMARLKASNKEGIVFKNLSAKWYAGCLESGGAAFKCKFYKTTSVIVVKVNAKRSVAMGVLDGEKIIPVGNVTISPNKDIPPVGALIEVRYLYAYKGGSLYQPTYLQDRSDELDRNECVISQLIYKPESETEED